MGDLNDRVWSEAAAPASAEIADIADVQG